MDPAGLKGVEAGRRQRGPNGDNDHTYVRFEGGIVAVTKIRIRMLEDGRPQYVIAADLGVSPARLSEYALGRRPIPPQRIFELMRLWNCNPDDILGYEDVSLSNGRDDP